MAVFYLAAFEAFGHRMLILNKKRRGGIFR